MYSSPVSVPFDEVEFLGGAWSESGPTSGWPPANTAAAPPAATHQSTRTDEDAREAAAREHQLSPLVAVWSDGIGRDASPEMEYAPQSTPLPPLLPSPVWEASPTSADTGTTDEYGSRRDLHGSYAQPSSSSSSRSALSPDLPATRVASPDWAEMSGAQQQAQHTQQAQQQQRSVAPTLPPMHTAHAQLGLFQPPQPQPPPRSFPPDPYPSPDGWTNSAQFAPTPPQHQQQHQQQHTQSRQAPSSLPNWITVKREPVSTADSSYYGLPADYSAGGQQSAAPFTILSPAAVGSPVWDGPHTPSTDSSGASGYSQTRPMHMQPVGLQQQQQQQQLHPPQSQPPQQTSLHQPPLQHHQQQQRHHQQLHHQQQQQQQQPAHHHQQQPIASSHHHPHPHQPQHQPHVTSVAVSYLPPLDTSQMAPPPPPPAHTHTGPKRVSRACIPCRRVKSGCDDARPCSRCVKHNRVCIDRPEEEVEAARLRRSQRAHDIDVNPLRPHKRHMPHEDHDSDSAPSAPHTATSDAHAYGPPSDTNSPSQPPASIDSDAASLQAYSRSFLTVSTQLGLRDLILRIHAQLSAMKVPIAVQVEWHTQVALCCLQCEERLTPEDFRTFLTGGLTAEQLSSPNWLSSPLAPWSQLATRPLHYAFQPNTVAIQSHIGGVSDDSPSSGGSADTHMRCEIRFEWLPAAHLAFQNWRASLEARLRNEQRLRTVRQSMSESGDGGPLPAATPVPEEQPDDEDSEQLVSRFGTLGISRSLAARPPIASEHDRVLSVHANWCPLGGAAALAEDDAAEVAKVKRTIGMDSVHAHTSSPTTHTDATSVPARDGVECVCGASTPLPARIFVNDVFERYFGWRRIDVERGMRAEGFRWHRRWRAQLAQILHFKPTIDSLLELKLPRPDALNPSQPDRSIPTVPSFLSRQGVLFSAESKWTYVKRSDGVHSAAGIIITWRLAEDANEQMEQMEQALRSRKQHTAPHATAATATTTSAAPAATRDA